MNHTLHHCPIFRRRPRVAIHYITGLCLLAIASVTTGQISISIANAPLSPPSAPTNVLTIDISAGFLGSDSDSSALTGTSSLILDAQPVVSGGSVSPEIVGMSFTGGSINAGDTSFRLGAGLISVNAVGLGGFPITLNPPGLVNAGTFDASEHTFVINRGTIDAAGQTTDFSTEPTNANGVGTGSLDLTPVGAASNNLQTYEFTASLDVNFMQTATVDTGIFGMVDVTTTGSGSLVTTGQFEFTTLVGDFTNDGQLECDDIDALGEAIRTSSTDGQFDLNGDGNLNSADYAFWVTDLKQTVVGDANFDFVTDTSDLNIWNANKFGTGKGWCEGDFNADGLADVSDLNIWNVNKFTAATAPVPEPATGVLAALMAIGGFTLFRRR